ncbi:hypothetical protein CANARDRAFT_230382 [[Candida] arabinofermentans NRRL YB-2248]|uniref:Endonuclease/exonuclease/phosphatase domain-containing protein n=1 Tax=[Candida] arabinofermentans NRRL YB-2248 TaxID=983967 RepID=A0A1E4T4H5_9ASCO|nr:hypothetical protein CANARDRAFT_230382 [[Candida] arabinofermentans NRRL YB-2248]
MTHSCGDTPAATLVESTKPSTKEKKKLDKRKKKLSEITPEYIAEQRRLRELKKEQKRQELIAQGIDPDNLDPPKYIKRELLSIPHSSIPETTIDLKIMTYNLLAQALIRRSMFPNNGDILKWNKRSPILLDELKHYDCDIMCLQEVDFIQFNNYWKVQLAKLGYLSKYYRSGDKNHGVCIFYKEKLFNLVDTSFIDYDREETGNISPRTITKNVGLLVGLQLKSNPDKCIVIGTTHLFWHPFGTYERTRQTYLVLSKTKEFVKRIQTLHPHITKTWKIFAGDFNSQPFDSPYLSITSKPISYDNRCKRVIACSTSFQFSKLRGGDGAEDEEDPVPESFDATQEQLDMVQQMQDLHNKLPLRAISMYSVAYKTVDEKNAGVDNDRGEPFFSNWAYTWRGLLDYIFLIKDWEPTETNKDVDSLEQLESEEGVILKSLLKLPHADEMNLGQPREGEYPSDHLALIAEIGFAV